ncbi:unnamed protein product [Periconia digitata]|uniref:Uncharacterized protein n=1 Tax=Periconia digitata TaxID=1303443 RepID=A0A9W4XGB1_9PLEO|nr:unnamed protein product [Periconia digitata]
MKFSVILAVLATLGSANSDVHPRSLTKRGIPYAGNSPTWGNLSYVTSWTYTSLAYTALEASNSTSELTWLCDNFNETSSRYVETFPDYNDITKISREVICDAVHAGLPPPSPIWFNNLWHMKTFMGGVFAVQGYGGTPFDKQGDNIQFFADMCWYVENSLLTGLWAPIRETEQGAIDVESAWCILSGYFGAGDWSQYNAGNVSAEVAAQADLLVSKVMARVFKVVAKEQKQIDYVCDNYERYREGIARMKLDTSAIEELICAGQNREVVQAAQAKTEMLDAMTDLYIFQMLHAGTYEGYHAYLCNTLRADTYYAKAGLDGKRVVESACSAAKT